MATASIHIKGKADPVIVSADIAKKVKEKWAGDNPVPRNQVLDLGNWCGEYGQIKSIEIDRLKKYDMPQPIEPELTPEQQTYQKAEYKKIIDKMTVEMKESGFLPKNYPNHKGKQPYEVRRSELNKYKETHKQEFKLPENSVIIED